jgi:hypothetical protein
MGYSDYSAPSVEGQALKRQLAPVLMRNIVQELIQTNGKGVTEEFSMDTSALEIRVVREKPLTQSARSIGEAADGGYFSSQTAEQPTSAEYGIRINLSYDTPIDIPSNMTDMFPLGVVEATLRNLRQAIAKNVNASTTAAQLVSYFNAIVATTIPNTTVQYIAGTDEFLDKFTDAMGVLDEGDIANGVDTFPLDGRVAMVRGAGKAGLLKFAGAVLEVGNFSAQDMLAVGAVSPNVIPNTSKNGFLGTIEQCDVYFQSNAIWALSKDYMALTTNAAVTAPVQALTTDEVVGYISAAQGTGRAIAFDSVVKTVPSQQGQGLRIQPKYRWGIETWFPGSIVAIVTDTFDLAGAAPWVATNKVIAPGSTT